MKIFYLIGFPASGKTGIAKKVAGKTSCVLADLDDFIEKKEGKTIAEIFSIEGENAFRQKESLYLKRLTQIFLEKQNPFGVIACGGGTPCFGENHAYMKENGKTVLIHPFFPFILERLIRAAPKRPMTQNLTAEEITVKMTALYHERLPEYLTADFIFSGTQNQILTQLLSLLQSD